MVIPPPNITGSLHIGHAMMIAIEDSIVRYKRLNGYDVVYLPGLDHAGIATQNVVMRMLGKATREEFMDAAFKWSDKYSNRIWEQIDRMGCSLDYSRKTFTLDAHVSKSVTSAFVRLHKKGLIYRDNKIVNWCGKLRTTLSDLEVNYKDIKGGTYMDVDGGTYKMGMMYFIKYKLIREGDDPCSRYLPYIVIGTTRPETILGDTAVCINPDDKRFKDIQEIFRNGKVNDVMNLRNKRCSSEKEEENMCDSKNTAGLVNSLEGLAIKEEMKMEKKNKYKTTKSEISGDFYTMENLFAINPLTGKKIPVICDGQADLSFGTGILKVTPAHDPVDFLLGKKHNLESIQVIDDDNKIIVESPYKGMKRFEARKQIVMDLKDVLVDAAEHDQTLPICSRSGDVIEPMVRDQWWLKSDEMARAAIEGVKNGEIKIYPEEAVSIWNRWLENIRDWCLSRQLWWGHRVPAYKAGSGSNTTWIVAETEEEALKIAKEKGYSSVTQDEDVLDTWFSSGLWPFSTMGWPNETKDMERYFPNSMLETGSDILFFWVARMVMLSYELCGKKPFDTILLHGIVRDAHGKKMSKSLGNVIDPLYVIDGITLDELINNLSTGNLDRREVKRASDALRKDFPKGIPKCGADALRFALLSYSNGMKDINLDILRVQGYSRLCNKLFHACNFIVGRFGVIKREQLVISPQSILEHHRWILGKLNVLIADQHKTFETYNFMLGTQSVYAFFLHDLCDVALEASKVVSEREVDRSVMGYVFTAVLRLLNPYMPFITEDLHVKLFGETIVDYPSTVDLDLSNSFDDVIAVAKLCRVKKVEVLRFDGSEYLNALVKGGVEIIDGVGSDFIHCIGSIRYREV
ncbi:valyl-tRNA synthetase [Pancytospora epiphaga]|nr:valyl-tRNA synthetase [Pancytospora epiphaga]